MNFLYNPASLKGAPSYGEPLVIWVGKEVVLLNMECGLNHKSKASKEETLSTPLHHVPPGI